MGKCYKYTMKISQYLDNELNDAEKKNFEQHCNECLSCRTKLLKTQELVKYLPGMPKPKPSFSFDVVLRSRLRQEIKSHQATFLPVFRPVWQLATICIVAGISVYAGMFLDQRLNQPAQIQTEQKPIYLRPTRRISAEKPVNTPGQIRVKNYVMDELKISDLTDRGQNSSLEFQATDSLASPQNPPTLRTASAIVRF